MPPLSSPAFLLAKTMSRVPRSVCSARALTLRASVLRVLVPGALLLLPTPSRALASPARLPLQACVSPALADTLVRVRYADTGASAYWLSRQQLQWPGDRKSVV